MTRLEQVMAHAFPGVELADLGPEFLEQLAAVPEGQRAAHLKQVAQYATPGTKPSAADLRTMACEQCNRTGWREVRIGKFTAVEKCSCRQ